MSKQPPSNWLLQFRDTLDTAYSNSLQKLASLFQSNLEWIEGQRRLAMEREHQQQELDRAAKEKQKKELEKRLKIVPVKTAGVQKSKGRPRKQNPIVEAAVVKQTEPETTIIKEISSPKIEAENKAPVVNVGSPKKKVVKEKAPKAPKNEPKKSRGRPKKTPAIIESPSTVDHITPIVLSTPVENLPIEPMTIDEPFKAEPTSEVIKTPIRPAPMHASPIPVQVEKEPAYVLAKSEKTQTPLAKRKSIGKTPLMEVVKSLIELEIVNPPGSLTKPRRSSIRAISSVKLVAQDQSPVPNDETPKVESWTSQFLKQAPPVQTEPVAVVLPVEEKPLSEITAPPVVPLPAVPPAIKANPAFAHIQAAESQASAESPLTRARRIDSQNTWREQQLSKFFVSKTEVLKNALDTLKVVKEEERSSFIKPVEKPVAELSLVTATITQSASSTVPETQVRDIEPAAPVKEETLKYIPTVFPWEEETPSVRRSPRKIIDKQSVFSPIVPKVPLVLSPFKGKNLDDDDIFKGISPLKMKKKDVETVHSGPASPSFLSALEAPTLDDTAIPDEIETIVESSGLEKLSDVFDLQIPSKRATNVAATISEEERIKRQRLKERQQQAIEKRNMQIKKAQETKAKQEELFNPKPRPLTTISMKGVSTGVPTKSQSINRSAAGSTISGLHKTAIFNASKANLSVSADKPDFKTPAAKVRSPATIKMAEKVVSSPMFPEIPSDEEDYLRRAGEGPGRPDWAVTPALKAALMDQQQMATDKIFDKIQPVRLEDIFKNKTFKRGRNSTIPFM